MAVNQAEFQIGDDIELGVQLKRKRAGDTTKQPFVVDTGATVVAQVVTIDRENTLGPEVTCLSNATGAAWATSLIVVEMTAAQSAQINRVGGAYMRVRITENSMRNTYYAPIELIADA